jgi:predicted aspartyl protease
LLQNIKSQGNLISFERTQKLLQEQLLLTPAHPGIHLSLAEAQFQQGQIQQALNTIEQGANLSQDGATALLSHRDAMVQEHIDFLLENDHWQEVITFVRSEPASASPHYYAHQLAAAHAHAQLFQWREAESLLNMAEFDPDLYTAIHQLRTTIKKGEEHMMLKQQELERKSIIAQHILGNTETDDQGYMKLPFEKDGHAILVPFSIGEHRLRLLFDTGASITMLSSSWIEKTKAHHLAQLDSKIFITAGGRVRSPMIRIQQVQFGPLRFDHVDMAFQDIFEAGSGIDGLLGMNVLKYFEIKFDFSASTLLLKAK